jgi:molybdate transport system regulatory protein
MRLSARNIFKGTVTEVVHGPVSAEVSITIAPGVSVVAVISNASAKSLGLAKGVTAHAVIKASSVMVGVD